VKTGTIRAAEGRRLIAALERAGMSLALWNATSDIGAPCVIARLCEDEANDRSALGYFWGAGCHLDPAVALTRAITEAAQSRLTLISGARDDLGEEDYAAARLPDAIAVALDRWEASMAGCRFESVTSLSTGTFEGDVAVLLDLLAAAGMGTAIAVDLAAADIAVVRVVVPGLEAHDTRARLLPGARLRALQ
jgi:ribosomal protein S12 methylthiotransferase accessory factor